MSEPKIIGARGSHDALREALAARQPRKILDAPCGRGPLTRFLQERGWDVSCCDIDPSLLEVEGPFRAANLNRGLPYADGEFDEAAFVNGIHRLFNPGGAVREFHRVLKPGGTLWVNVNNYASIRRRVRFLFYGSLDNALNDVQCDQGVSDPEANVRVPILYPQIANLLESAGFEVVSVRAADRRAGHVALAPLAWVIRGAALLIGPRSRKRNRVREANSGALCPGGNYMLIEARKRG